MTDLFGEQPNDGLSKEKQENGRYKRKENDAYFTPSWVTEYCIIPEVLLQANIVEPAVGDGGIRKPLAAHGHNVFGIDINPDPACDLVANFLDLKHEDMPFEHYDIVTNPPFKLGPQFIEHGLDLISKSGGKMVLLLPIAFGRAGTRQHLFNECPYFSKKVEMTSRILWDNIVHKLDKNGKQQTPTKDHAIYVWSAKNIGRPTLSINQFSITDFNKKKAVGNG